MQGQGRLQRRKVQSSVGKRPWWKEPGADSGESQGGLAHGQLKVERDFLSESPVYESQRTASPNSRDHQQLSLVRQCILWPAGPRYYRPTDQGRRPGVDGPDGPCSEDPLYGSRKMKAGCWERLSGEPKKGWPFDGSGSHLSSSQHQQTSARTPDHPYLLKGVEVNRVDQVWAADIPTSPWRRASPGGHHGLASRHVWPGNSPTPWTPASVWRRWRKL